jgi:hypothetical protein
MLLGLSNKKKEWVGRKRMLRSKKCLFHERGEDWVVTDDDGRQGSID